MTTTDYPLTEALAPWSSMSPNQASRATRIDPELIGDVRDEVAWSLAVQGLRHRSTLTERFAISIEWAISRIIIERRREGV